MVRTGSPSREPDDSGGSFIDCDIVPPLVPPTPKGFVFIINDDGADMGPSAEGGGMGEPEGPRDDAPWSAWVVDVGR